MYNKTGLGKGLGSLIPMTPKKESIQQTNNQNVKSEDFVEDRIFQIEIDLIKPNPLQPRRVFDENELQDLVASIKEHGILQPLIVTQKLDGGFELIAGERRLRSAKIAFLKTVPAIIRKADELEKLELALIENIQRQDLNPIEKAESYAKLLEEFGLTQEEASKRLGVNRSTFANTIRLLSLPLEIKQAILEGKLSAGHARAIISLSDENERMNLFKRIINIGLNVRDTERYVQSSRRVFKNLNNDFVDPNIEDKRNRIQSSLGTKVEIKKTGNKGKIILHFYSDEELTEITNKIGIV